MRGRCWRRAWILAKRYCHERCAACGRVCPTGALAGFSLDEKRLRRLGVAHVIRTECIAWGHGGYCMACREACPYNAIGEVWHGVPCPVVREDRCRGCGACEARCPARPARAIVVRARGRQDAIAPGSVE